MVFKAYGWEQVEDYGVLDRSEIKIHGWRTFFTDKYNQELSLLKCKEGEVEFYVIQTLTTYSTGFRYEFSKLSNASSNKLILLLSKK